RGTWRAVTVVTSICALLFQSTAFLLGAQAGSAPKPATTGSQAQSDGGWPRNYATSNGGSIQIFQPQIASWDGQRRLVAYSAVSYSAKGASKVALGTIKLEADTSVAVAERLVNFSQVKITESNFPGLPNDQLKEAVDAVQQAVPQGSLVIA